MRNKFFGILSILPLFFIMLVSCSSSEIKSNSFSPFKILHRELPRGPASSALNCGFETKEQFFQAGKKNLDEFPDLKFSPDFTQWWTEAQGQDLNSFLEEYEKEIKKQRNAMVSNIRKYPWAQNLYDIRKEIIAKPELAQLSPYLWYDFSATDNCESVACTMYGSYGIQAPPAYVTQIYAKYSKDKADQIMKTVLTHEVGHYVAESNLRARFTSLKDMAQYLQGNGLKHHLTVDSISIAITSTNIDDFIGFLEDSVKDEKEKGDVLDRVNCLKKLNSIAPTEQATPSDQ